MNKVDLYLQGRAAANKIAVDGKFEEYVEKSAECAKIRDSFEKSDWEKLIKFTEKKAEELHGVHAMLLNSYKKLMNEKFPD